MEAMNDGRTTGEMTLPASRRHGSLPVSVILPFYNAARHLGEAIQSILCQTYPDFELILIDDGSSDGSAAIARSFTDPRIRFVRQQNAGLAATLNKAIGLARYDFIARMDADDLSFPERFEKQIAFLDAHPECGMVGTWASIWEGDRESGRAHRHPAENSQLKFELLFDNPFVHSSMMIRRCVFERVGMYAVGKDRQPQDYELWSRVMRQFAIANIPEILQVYREVDSSISRTRKENVRKLVMDISAENLAWISGRAVSDPVILHTVAFSHWLHHSRAAIPSFAQMSRLLLGAAETLGGTSDEKKSVLRQRALERIEIIRSMYFPFRYGRFLGQGMRWLESAFSRPGVRESKVFS